jgi:hypothetical protein
MAIFQGDFKLPADNGIPVRGEDRFLMIQEILPGSDAPVPKMLLGFWPDSSEMDKGVF